MMDLASAQGAYLTKDIAGIRCREYPPGRWVPTASAALDLLFPEQGEWIRQADLDRGTRCHAWMEQFCRWLYDAAAYQHPNDLKDESEQRCVAAAADFLLRQKNIKILAVERPLWSMDESWSATPDLIFLQNGKNIGWDWKFAETLSERFYVQAEADRHLTPWKINDMYLIRINRLAEVRKVHVKPNPHRWVALMNAFGVLKWRLRHAH
jgi:hypothetical protein